ncbi:hypothetical protein C8R45DRAFT_1067083 [Mycena sanguinolenta]|nr:hypothetical protein C8R45DRAFT_1067083 [Mycena sanguinolenta]
MGTLSAPSGIPNERSAPVVLSAVCRSWRDIAFTTPVLWSKLEVRFNYFTIEAADLALECIDRWLSRARSRPLSLMFDYSGHDLFPLSRLRGIIHRWSHLVQNLHLDVEYCNIRPLGLDSMAFPILQAAELDCDSDHSDAGLDGVFSNAPNLHDLRVYGAPITFAFPWSQLTRFVGPISDLALFTLAPELTEMKCHCELDDGDFPVSIHRHLKSLTIGTPDFGNGADILQYLILPALQHLDVSGTHDHDSLESFLVRSSPPLVSLALRGSQVCLQHWGQYILRVPATLESLENHHMSDSFTLGLFGLFSEAYPLPNLRNLSLIFVDGPLQLGGLVYVLYARASHLRTVKVRWACSEPPFLGGRVWAGPPETPGILDTVIGHLLRLSQDIDIHLGTADENFVSNSNATI